MTDVVVAAMAASLVIMAIEELLMPLNKFKGLIALIMATVGTLVLRPMGWDQIIYSMAATFLSLTSAVIVETVFTGKTRRESLGLPNRIPSR